MRPWKRSTRAAAMLMLAPAACGPSPGTGPALRPAVESVVLHPTEEALPREPLFTSWLPDLGRMNREVRARHLPPGPTWLPVFTDDFRDASGEAVPGWRIVDFPSLRVTVLDGQQCIEIRGPADMKASCGLECDLNAASIAGRDVRLDLCLTCRSRLRVEVAQGIRVTVTARDGSGQMSSVTVPLETGVSPGWEWHHSWLRFQPGLQAATLRILAERPVATATLSSVRLLAYQPARPRDAPAARPAAAGPAIRDAAEVHNWIVDGRFETGLSGFYASAIARWPNGEERTIPIDWRWSQDAAEGSTSLLLAVPEFGGRIGFGPVNLDRAAIPPPQVHLGFMARSTRPTTLTAHLRTRNTLLAHRTFALSSTWQRFRGAFKIDASPANDRRELSATELVFEFAGDRAPEANECGLDAVTLTDSLVDAPGLQNAPVEIGISGLSPASGDLGHLIDARARASVSVKLVGGRADTVRGMPNTSQPARTDPPRVGLRPAGQLAIDLLDAWDRSVSSLTRPITLPTSGVVIENIGFDNLPRGYYRLVASLWEGKPGDSAMIGQASYALGVLSWSDAVPKDNPYGLSTWDGNVSALTTHLGAGWVRMDLPTKQLQTGPAVWGFATWGAMMGACRAGQVDVITALTLPADAETRQAFVEQWLADGSLWPGGVLVRRPSISAQPVGAYLAELKWLREQLARRAPGIRLVSDSLVDGQAIRGVVLGIACPATPLPEECERQLEAIGQHQATELVVWDPCVPVRLGGAQAYGTSPFTFASRGRGPIQLLEGPIDPVVSASRMVRSLLIRSLAAAQLSCSEAMALAPVRSVFEDDHGRLHEQDLSPRPALVAFDVLTELLNHATLKRWVDVPGGARALYFEASDGGAVAAVWRPYGLSPTRLGLAGLGPSVTAIDCMGAREPTVMEGSYRVLEANEIVRFLIAAERDRASLQRSLENIRVLLDAESQPTR